MDVRVYAAPLDSTTWTRESVPLALATEGAGLRRLGLTLQNLLRTRRDVDPRGVVVFTDDTPLTASLFALLARGGRRPTIVRTDPLLHAPRSRWRRSFVRACLAAVDRLIVWAPAVAERYHRAFGIPHARMVPVHFHHTLQGHALPPARPGDYLFSGGDSMRDYPTLLEAVRGLRLPVRIATRWQPPANQPIPENVTLGPTSDIEFRALLAGARLVAFPLRTDSLRTSGQQSYLNAMALGRPVIVTDPHDAPYYIEDRRTGRIVPSGDAVALRTALDELLDSPEHARALGERGRAFALPLDQDHTWGRVLALALDAHGRRHETLRAEGHRLRPA